MLSKLECVHADTCLPDYWGGHQLPHVQIEINEGGMWLKDLKNALHNELCMGAVAGVNYVHDDVWYKKAHAAINRLTPTAKGKLFTHLESGEGEGDTVYAFFCFTEV